MSQGRVKGEKRSANKVTEVEQKKWTFRKFTYGRVDLDQLLDTVCDQLLDTVCEQLTQPYSPGQRRRLHYGLRRKQPSSGC
eukprot:bmy_18077T0